MGPRPLRQVARDAFVGNAQRDHQAQDAEQDDVKPTPGLAAMVMRLLAHGLLPN
jgi:hypothetical protein